jgi:hypothetical protein
VRNRLALATVQVAVRNMTEFVPVQIVRNRQAAL